MLAACCLLLAACCLLLAACCLLPVACCLLLAACCLLLAACCLLLVLAAYQAGYVLPHMLDRCCPRSTLRSGSRYTSVVADDRPQLDLEALLSAHTQGVRSGLQRLPQEAPGRLKLRPPHRAEHGRRRGLESLCTMVDRPSAQLYARVAGGTEGRRALRAVGAAIEARIPRRGASGGASAADDPSRSGSAMPLPLELRPEAVPLRFWPREQR